MTYLSGSIRLHWLIELCESTQISQTKPLPGSRYVLHQNLFSVRPLKKFSYKTFFTLVCKRTTILYLPQHMRTSTGIVTRGQGFLLRWRERKHRLFRFLILHTCRTTRGFLPPGRVKLYIKKRNSKSVGRLSYVVSDNPRFRPYYNDRK